MLSGSLIVVTGWGQEVKAEPRLIVRNTVLDVEDDEELARQAERQVRDARRPKTTMVFPVAWTQLALLTHAIEHMESKALVECE